VAARWPDVPPSDGKVNQPDLQPSPWGQLAFLVAWGDNPSKPDQRFIPFFLSDVELYFVTTLHHFKNSIFLKLKFLNNA
jgi:hypothetical protein